MVSKKDSIRNYIIGLSIFSARIMIWEVMSNSNNKAVVINKLKKKILFTNYSYTVQAKSSFCPDSLVFLLSQSSIQDQTAKILF